MKEVANATTKEKSKATEVVEKKAQSLEKAQLLVEGKLAEEEDKLGGVELKLVEAARLNLAQAYEIADLKAALEACESKWYTRASQMPRDSWSLLSIMPGPTGSGRDDLQPFKQWGCPKIPC